MAALIRKENSKKYLVTISRYGDVDIEYINRLLGPNWKIVELERYDERLQAIENMRYRYVLYDAAESSGRRNITASNNAEFDIFGDAIFCEDFEIDNEYYKHLKQNGR